ncbi:MAG: hypothetical protein KY459_03380 [Acidobacteria bacterium]|nr:hypothetical protein [Acidobacteriota bacterium]
MTETEATPESEEVTVVDGFTLEEPLRSCLSPGAFVRDFEGKLRRLPRFFLRVPSKKAAWNTYLTTHFAIGEFLRVDLKEAEPLRSFPRYIPTAVRFLALTLQNVRNAVGSTLNISVNGGYRSPLHQRGHRGDPHRWACGADIYRIGSTLIDGEEPHEKFASVVREVDASLRISPWGSEPGHADDHLHLDIGYALLDPPELEEDPREVVILPDALERRVHSDRRRDQLQTGEPN